MRSDGSIAMKITYAILLMVVCALRKGPSRKSLLRMMRLASTLECATRMS